METHGNMAGWHGNCNVSGMETKVTWTLEAGRELKRALSVIGLADKYIPVTVEGMGDRIAITQRTGDIWVTHYMTVISAPPLRFRVFAGELRKALSYAKAKRLSIEFGDDCMYVACYDVVGATIADHTVEVPIQVAADDPIPAPTTCMLALSKEQVQQVFRDVSFCIDPYHYKAWMTGVFVVLRKDGMTFFGTDGFRLVRLHYPGEQPYEGEHNIPFGAWKYLSKLVDGDVRIYIEGCTATFFADNFVLRCHLINETRPSLDFLFDLRDEVCVEMDRKSLADFIGRIIKKSTRKEAFAHLIASDDSCIIKVERLGVGTEETTLPAKAEANLPMVSFVCEYLHPILERLRGNSIMFHFDRANPSTSFVRITCEDEYYEAVLMPCLYGH